MKETDINKWATLMIERIQSLSGKDGWKKPWFTEGALQWQWKGQRTQRCRILLR